jgi:hypothetical protein
MTGKYIHMQANMLNNRMSIARQRHGKHASLTTEALVSVWSVQCGYKEVFSRTEH